MSKKEGRKRKYRKHFKSASMKQFRTLLQPETKHFAGIFSGLTTARSDRSQKSQRLKSGLYVASYTRPIPSRRILQLFKPRFFATLKIQSLDQKKKICAILLGMMQKYIWARKKKRFGAYRHFDYFGCSTTVPKETRDDNVKIQK